jgi:sugar transferase EpsL
MKRTLDIFGCTLGLFFALPIVAVAALAIRAFMGTPILFHQTRAGLDGKPFTLHKLRTMTRETDNSGAVLPDGARLTSIGRFLRTFSVDELPQLVNILRGDMSLVGPRPLPVEYVPRFTEFQMRRHEVKPGITGWAQVNGRNALSWEERLEMDVWYVENRSIGLDIKILGLTAWKVLKREGTSALGHATMPEFLGRLPQSRRDE